MPEENRLDETWSELQRDLLHYIRKIATKDIASQLVVHLEQDRQWLNSATDYILEHFLVSPAATTFTTIFFTLSILPVLSFIGISIFIVSLFTFTALALAFVASTVVEIMLVGILILIFAVIFCLSACITAFGYDGRPISSNWVRQVRNQAQGFLDNPAYIRGGVPRTKTHS
ncbi:hypothetical protein BJ138DRAFT_612128 [Hygrophoropsis aurantiaca]|uniref:Uncharacterized protein n=1 Tax=Hygrophoropsis aurantiaca TaxID=72124 RepID=A0ACB8A0T1_9AGAM|nr:hypothetical protein BJ138DRAFT_612128 [Hygrophoropsis aurantiaca]